MNEVVLIVGEEDNIKIELTTTDYEDVKCNKLPHSRASVVTDMNFKFHNINFLNRSQVGVPTAQGTPVP
jgi:hypothetical protein